MEQKHRGKKKKKKCKWWLLLLLLWLWRYGGIAAASVMTQSAGASSAMASPTNGPMGIFKGTTSEHENEVPGTFHL